MTTYEYMNITGEEFITASSDGFSEIELTVSGCDDRLSELDFASSGVKGTSLTDVRTESNGFMSDRAELDDWMSSKGGVQSVKMNDAASPGAKESVVEILNRLNISDKYKTAASDSADADTNAAGYDGEDIHSTCLLPDDVFRSLNVKDKTKVFNHFLEAFYTKFSDLLTDASEKRRLVELSLANGSVPTPVETEAQERLSDLIEVTQELLEDIRASSPADSHYELPRSVKRKFSQISSLPFDLFAGPRKIRHHGDRIGVIFYSQLVAYKDMLASALTPLIEKPKAAESDQSTIKEEPKAAASDQSITKDETTTAQVTDEIQAPLENVTTKRKAPPPPLNQSHSERHYAQSELDAEKPQTSKYPTGVRSGDKLKKTIVKTKAMLSALGKQVGRSISKGVSAVTGPTKSSSNDQATRGAIMKLDRHISRLLDECAAHPNMPEDFRAELKAFQLKGAKQQQLTPNTYADYHWSSKPFFDPVGGRPASQLSTHSCPPKTQFPEPVFVGEIRRHASVAAGGLACLMNDQTDAKTEEITSTFWLDIGGGRMFKFPLKALNEEQVLCRFQLLSESFVGARNDEAIELGIDQWGCNLKEQLVKKFDNIHCYEDMSVFWIAHKLVFITFFGLKVPVFEVRTALEYVRTMHNAQYELCFGVDQIDFSRAMSFHMPHIPLSPTDGNAFGDPKLLKQYSDYIMDIYDTPKLENYDDSELKLFTEVLAHQFLFIAAESQAEIMARLAQTQPPRTLDICLSLMSNVITKRAAKKRNSEIVD